MGVFEAWDRQWFALCSSGDLVPLGDHGDYEAADATANDLGLETIWLTDAETVTQWQETIALVQAAA